MKEYLVADGRITHHAKEDERSVLLPKLVCIEVGHLVIQGCHTSYIAKYCEQDGVPASCRMLHPELLTISEALRVFLDKVGSFEANVQAQLLLALNELVDIVEGTGLLAAPHYAHVVPSGHS